MDKSFKRIVTESTETMKKLRLVLNFDEDGDNLDLDEAIKLAQTRQFFALKPNSVYKVTDPNDNAKLVLLLQLLSGSVEDLTVGGEISKEFLSSIIAMFVPKLKKCKLDNVWFEPEASPIINKVNARSNVNHPLESLEIIETRAELLQFFAGCNQLKTN